MAVLPFVDLRDLEAVSFVSFDEETIEIDELVKTEQWKKARRVCIGFRVLNLKVEDVCQFAMLNIQTHSITVRDLDFFKKTFISSSIFENALFGLKNFDELEEIINLWGPAFATFVWYFRMKNAEEKILEIEYSYSHKSFFFRAIESEDVPDRAIVQDYNEN
ncbi:unnamed protein product [Caenorhabditis nigoni]